MKVVCPEGREEDALEASPDGLLEEVGSKSIECDELGGGVWLEPSQTMLHRGVMRKLVVEGGWG